MTLGHAKRTPRRERWVKSLICIKELQKKRDKPGCRRLAQEDTWTMRKVPVNSGQ